jgi:hypothetical protein
MRLEEELSREAWYFDLVEKIHITKAIFFSSLLIFRSFLLMDFLSTCLYNRK